MKNIKRHLKAIRIDLLIYYISLWLYFISGSLANSMLGQIRAVTFIIRICFYAAAMGLLVRIVLLKKTQLLSFNIVTVTLITSAVIYYFSRSTIPMLVFLTLLGAENSNSRVIGMIYFFSSGIIMVISTLLSLAGVIEDRIFIFGVQKYVRHSFGMTYATIWAAYGFFILATMFYLRKNKLKPIDYLLCAAFSYVTYQYCHARLEAGMIIVLILLLTFLTVIENMKLFKWATTNSFLFSAVSVYCLQYAFSINPDKFKVIDYYLSWRLQQTAKVLSQYGFKLFGQVMRMQGNGTVNFDPKLGYFFVDSFYLNYGLRYGIVFIVLLTAIITMVFYKLYYRKYYRELVFFALASFHGIIISSIMLPFMNPLFLMAYAEYSKE